MVNKKALLSILLLAGCLGCGSAPVADTSAQDQAAIRALEDHFVTAFNARDVSGIMAAYAPGDTLVVFDAVPPRQYNGWAAYKKDWEDTFAAFPGPVEMKTTDLDVAVGGDVAFSHCIQSGTLTGKDGKPFPLTVRVTDGYRKISGQWLITHEHVSVPVDMATMKGDPNSK